ncbi:MULTISPECIES: ABC transporter substrate-binding protein [unclassified Oceanispirochaeta]|uniref:ABC transporter substrate-binding protein n=1 Tax=unclassified Oceanispirochaeta TaxID=2635722 RepID=UPI000E090390|nr:MULTISPECIES: extracellular solute-binding protein [unclassified Oceanispirochaeta]MBF9014998.1 extracellular solute-binding protein [Oceanispirochaeta sp. M2]NPD71321.1 extracellular solute-binding protein [Oceanispirochaeta sp. M1]RDG33287.1 extracellular solute-binding protein [Oceanispirochaeta sp. M1]
MKKVVLSVLCLTLASVLSWSSGQNEEGPVELNFWTWHPSAEIHQPIIEQFEAENEGVTVNLTVMESTVFQEKLPIALASEEDLDVIGIQAGLMPSQLKGYMTPLDDYFASVAGSDWEKIFNPLDLAISKNQTESDELLFITNGRYGSAIGLYNVDIFNELGLTVPTTYEEMKAVAAVIQEKRPDIQPVVFTGDTWFLDEMVLTILSQESDLFNDIRYATGGRWDDPAYVQALTDFKKMFDDGVFQNMNDVGYGRASELFDTGKAAIFYQGTWEAPRLSSKFRNDRGIELNNVGAMPMPVMRAGGKATLRAFPDGGMAIPEYSEHKSAAANFIFYMNGGDGFDMMNTDTFLVPNKVNSKLPAELFNSAEGREGWDLVVKLVSESTSHRNNMSAFSSVLGQYIQKVIGGDYGDDIQRACEEIQKEFATGKYE